MPKDPRVDSYIEKQADFARPILEHLREIAHSVHDFDETVKWGMPAFMYKGRMLAHMAGFKGHATFAFWRGDEIVGEASRKGEAMGQFGRLESTNDLRRRHFAGHDRRGDGPGRERLQGQTRESGAQGAP